MSIARVTSKGQVTIPQHIRERFGLLPYTEVDFVVDGDVVRLVKVESPGGTESRADRAIRLLRGVKSTMSTDEIMALTRSEEDEED